MAFLDGFFAERDAKTAEAFEHPAIGDLFTEMFAYWVYVIDVKGNYVTIMEANPPCTLPKDGKTSTLTRAGFKKKFAYGSSTPGYWVSLDSRGNDVVNWLPASKKPEEEQFVEIW